MIIKKINNEIIEIDGVVHKLNKNGNYEVKNPKRWRAEENEEYFYLNSVGKKDVSYETNYEADNNRYNIGNYHKTMEQVEDKKQFDISSQKIKESAERFVGGWKDKNKKKYSIYFSWNTKKYGVSVRSDCQSLHETYFPTIKQAEKCIEENEADLNVVRDYKG